MLNYNFLRKELPSEIFKPYRLRMLTITLVILIWLGCYALLATTELHFTLKLLLALVIGFSWGSSGFLAHELLHGSIVRNIRLQNIFGFITLMPFFISPTFWRFWHNNLHHSYTQKLVMDPDAYPTYRLFRHSKFAQWMYPITPGSGYKRSYLYFFFWFSVNTFMTQFYFRYHNRIFEGLNHRRVSLELALQFFIMFSLFAWVGWTNLLWAFIIPFAIQNYYVFSYISTNHNLSPLTKKNDPLDNSLTVTNHPLLERLHFNFGYHVEHHMFPTLNPKFIKPAHELLKVKYPDRYQYMTKWQAIKKLYQTARIYKSSEVLMNPITNETYPTIPANLNRKRSQAELGKPAEDLLPEEESLTQVPLSPQS